MATQRLNRINEEIKRELTYTIRTMKDPRIPEFFSVVAARTTPDLKFCKVYVSFLDDKLSEEAVRALNSAASFIRRELGQKIRIRTVPEFHFVADFSIAYGSKINKILSELNLDKDVGPNGENTPNAEGAE